MTTIRPAVASVSALPPVGPRRRGPACPGLISFAGAVGTATGLSLRSPRTVKIFFRDAGTTVPAAPAMALFLAR
jgi:hypothetical protein